jgi:hypothetical protein
MDQNKKTMRHFYCRDVLWEVFEQMANDFDCSIDYLINEAMRYYARSKNYAVQAGPGGPPGSGPQGAVAAQAPRPSSGGGGGGGPAAMPQQPQGRRPPPPPGGGGAPALPTAAAHSRRTSQQPNVRPSMGPNASASPPLAAAPAPRTSARPEAGGASTGTLFLIFNNQRIPIDKDQFIIGRGSKTSDLAIKDGNISRKHAAVIRRNGTFYIKDLGSTNGIDYKGMRIDNKRIDEGDVFHLCDYELRFTYRG